ncbi:MAG: type II secretion system protein GspG [Planctomycetes bacterium]|nr:type II secretion system protein GspG [Planctomycetota bacterium]
MTAGTGTCPFAPLLERDLAGPSLEEDELSTLEAHLARGCPSCELLLDSRLSEDSDEQRALDAAVTQAVEDAAERMAPARARVLARVDDELSRDRAAELRRLRRRHLRALFYLTNVVALVLLVVAYVGTAVVLRVQVRAAQRRATDLEVQALVRALTRYFKDHGRLPADARALAAELARPSGRGAEGAPYHRFDPALLVEGEYVDAFGRPYRYVPGRDRALIYSVGPDGIDDGGQRDDVGAWVYFIQD